MLPGRVSSCEKHLLSHNSVLVLDELNGRSDNLREVPPMNQVWHGHHRRLATFRGHASSSPMQACDCDISPSDRRSTARMCARRQSLSTFRDSCRLRLEMDAFSWRETWRMRATVLPRFAGLSRSSVLGLMDIDQSHSLQSLSLHSMAFRRWHLGSRCFRVSHSRRSHVVQPLSPMLGSSPNAGCASRRS
jgi:hypothetical protein